MKSIWMFFGFAAIILINGCAGFGKTADRDDWYLLMGANTYARHQKNLIDIDKSRAMANTDIILEQKLYNAIESEDENGIKKWSRIRKDVNNNSPYRNVKMINSSRYAFQVKGGEFDGLYLRPGEGTNYPRSIPKGEYTFYVTFRDSGGKTKTWPVSRIIQNDTNQIVLGNVVR